MAWGDALGWGAELVAWAVLCWLCALPGCVGEMNMLAGWECWGEGLNPRLGCPMKFELRVGINGNTLLDSVAPGEALAEGWL